jgi:hypothetical protein
VNVEMLQYGMDGMGGGDWGKTIMWKEREVKDGEILMVCIARDKWCVCGLKVC